MKIKREYNKNINLGNYETARIGIAIEKEIPDETTKKNIINISSKLLDLCKQIVNEELVDLKEQEK